MSPMFLLLSVLFFFGPTLCSTLNVININSSSPVQFSSLAWDAATNHFIAGSAESPTVYAISDAGMVEYLLSEPSANSSNVSVSSVAVDHVHGRLIAAFSNPSSVAFYDLKSYKRICSVPLPMLDGASGGVAVDVDSGETYVSSAVKGVVLKVEPDGDGRVISEFQIDGDHGLGGLVYVNHGYILVVQPMTGKLFKMDSIDGLVQEVLSRDGSKPLALAGQAIAMQTESSVAVATKQDLLSVKSTDSWTQATVAQTEFKLGKGETAVAVTMGDGKNAYLLVKQEEQYVIEMVSSREPAFQSKASEALVILLVVAGLSGELVCLLVLSWQRLNNKIAEPAIVVA